MASQPLHITPYVRYISRDTGFRPDGSEQFVSDLVHIGFTGKGDVDTFLPAEDAANGEIFGCETIVIRFTQRALPAVYHVNDAGKARYVAGDQSRWISMARDAIAQHLDRQAVAS